ncbi:orotidine-5'-phosphate decarboxylase [Patescibacteria group bacterium]|nr:orotidine-5'-phosphate decarboxylase [Patescibacteria group bacterium]
MKPFVDRLEEAKLEKESILCVGLDPQVRYIPEHILRYGYENMKIENYAPGGEGIARAIMEFNRLIIKAAAPFAAVAKPQTAFYEKYGYWGMWALQKTVEMCRKEGLLVLEDAKRCDGGDTAEAYAQGHMGKIEIWMPNSDPATRIEKHPSFLNFDAMTVVPYIGTSCISQFRIVVEENKKGIFVVDKTSFSPNSEIEQLQTISGLKVWEETAKLVRQWSDSIGCSGEFGNSIGVVMGATYPEDALKMRELLPESPFLVPGYGAAQGGGADGAVAGIKKNGLGVIVNSSRDINYAYIKDHFKSKPEDFAQAAGKAAEFSRDDLNAALKKKLGKLPW